MAIQLHLIVIAIITFTLVAMTTIASIRFKQQWALKQRKRNPRYSYIDYSKDDLSSWWVRTLGFIFAPMAILILVISLVPFNPAYWVLTQHSGTVVSISNRFVDGTGDVSGATYTLTLEGDPTPRVVVDSRILGIETGDHVDMTCSLGWVYGGADKSTCYLRSF